MKATLEKRLEEVRPVFAEVWFALDQCLTRAGLEPIRLADNVHSRSELREDPFDHSQALYAEWRASSGMLLGSILVNGDGQTYAEFDVLRPHPQKPRWVVEAATAWGRSGAIKGELRLLPALE